MSESEQTIRKYFTAWETQDASNLDEIFTSDARYIVHPFGIETHVGLDAIRAYWEANPIGKQIDPKPRIITLMMEDNSAFIEWDCGYMNLERQPKEMRGMMLLMFENGLIKELREHYETHIK